MVAVVSRGARNSLLTKRSTSSLSSSPASGPSSAGQGTSGPNLSAAAEDRDLPQLYLRVENGKGFSPAQGFLYCTVKLEGVAEQSNYVLASAEPKWRDEFVFHVRQKMSCVEVIFYFVDAEGAQTSYLGECNIPIHTLPSHKLLVESFALESQSRSGSSLDARKEVQIVLYNSLQKSAMDALRELDDVYIGFLNICKDNMGLFSLMFDCIDASESDRVAGSVVSMFNFLKQEVELFQWVIRVEVESTSSMSVLFRSNSMAIRLVSLFAKVTAISYLKSVLLPLIEETLALDCSVFEVDPTRLDPGSSGNLKKNQKALEGLVNKYLDAILASLDRVPRKLRRVCALFVDLVEGKFPGGSTRAVGGFFFLRFLCPAIVAPASFGLLAKHPSGPSHRALLLTVKVLQNLSNNTSFKEPEMECFNPFLVARQADLTAFLKELTNCTGPSEGEVLLHVRPAVVVEGCVLIAKLLRQNASRMREKLEEDENSSTLGLVPSVFTDLDKILKVLAQNEQVQEKPYNAAVIESTLRKDGVVKIQVRSRMEEEAADDEEDADILNVSRLWQRPTRPSAPKDLVVSALDMYLSECQKAGKAKSVDWVAVYGSKGPRAEQFRQLEASVCELQKTDFQQMLSLPQKVAYWLNVYHTLSFHILFTVGFPKTAHAEKLFYTHFRYRMGPFTLSLKDIENGVLRGNLPDKHGVRQWRETDKRRILCLPKDPHVLLALANFTVHSPVVVAYTMQVDKQLTGVLSHFLNSIVTVEAPRKEVTLPRQLNRFASEYPSVAALNSDPEKATIAWIYDFLVARKKLDLIYLQGKTCNLIISKKGGKMMGPAAVTQYYADFENAGGAVQRDELPDVFKMGGGGGGRASSAAVGGAAATLAPLSPVLASLSSSAPSSSSWLAQSGETGEGSSHLSRVSSSSKFSPLPPSTPSPPPGIPAASPQTGDGPGASLRVSDHAIPRTRMQRQESLLNEDVMRDSLASMVKQLTGDLYDGQGVAQSIYSDVCRTISVTTAFNTGKIIREVKVSLLELPGINWTLESLEKFKQGCPLETPEMTRLQRMSMAESKQQQLLKLLYAIQTAVVDIRFLMENVVLVLNKEPTRALALVRVVPNIKNRLEELLGHIQAKNAESAPLEEMIKLEAAIAPEIDSLVALLGIIKEQLRGIDLANESGKTSVLACASVLAWVKQQLESPKAGPMYVNQKWDKKNVEELSVQKIAEITQLLKNLIESVTRRLQLIKSKLLVDATSEKLLEVAEIIRNCRAALLSQ